MDLYSAHTHLAECCSWVVHRLHLSVLVVSVLEVVVCRGSGLDIVAAGCLC